MKFTIYKTMKFKFLEDCTIKEIGKDFIINLKVAYYDKLLFFLK